MRDFLPEVLDLKLLGKCQLECPFCFGPRHEIGAIKTDVILSLIHRFSTLGVRNIVFTGGEPLLVKDLPLILKEAKQCGLGTVLSTNGLLLERRLDELGPYLDWIGLPLDGDCSEINELMRPGDPGHFRVVLSLLVSVKERFPAIRIKLGTVVAAANRRNVAGIAALIADRKPDVWKLYQVAYSGYGLDNRTAVALTSKEFAIVAKEVERLARTFNIRSVLYKRKEREGRYLFLEPSGDAVVVADRQEKVIGNFLSDFEGVVRSWKRFVDHEALRRNFTITYPASA